MGLRFWVRCWVSSVVERGNIGESIVYTPLSPSRQLSVFLLAGN